MATGAHHFAESWRQQQLVSLMNDSVVVVVQVHGSYPRIVCKGFGVILGDDHSSVRQCVQLGSWNE